MSEQDKPASNAGRERRRDQQAHVHGRRGRRRPRRHGDRPGPFGRQDHRRPGAADRQDHRRQRQRRRVAERRQAHRDPDAGEPQLRPLLRHPVRGAPASPTRTRSPGGLRPVRLRARRRGHRGRLHPAVQPAEQPADRERVRHQRHRPQLGRPAQQLERRGDEPVHRLPPGHRRRQQRPDHDGLLHPRRAAVLPLSGRRVHDLRRLPLLGARPDRPEPADGVLGLDRPGRALRAARSSPPPPTGWR